ncbi:AlbA family DNA-binding domain-containing protein [Streptosporangium sandarakinum]|uniref:AlbA family DNA-binding domain-containing protein n=1 Tax=Streptosporangium sandarakinum TaxID=1260955 RepID=UPI0036BA8B78
MIFRSARLNAIFGAPPEAVTYEQLVALTENDAADEAEDLDYKMMYKPGDEGAEDIAIDIATFANHRGGVLVIGMAEANARPSKAVGVELSDGLKRRILSTAAQRIFPTPQFELRPVAAPTDNNSTPTGLMLIIVPPSSTAPHAVVNPNAKDKLAYPRRHGSQKIWLSESEVAAAYRRRFVAAADQATRLADIETDAVIGIERMRGQNPPAPLLIVSLVPDVPGDFVIDRDSFHRFHHDIQQQTILVGSTGMPEANNAAVGQRRLICFSGGGWLNTRAEFHNDGSGTLATQLPVESTSGDQLQVWDSTIVVWIASALRYLARHARDRTGASGIAATTATLLSAAEFHPSHHGLRHSDATVAILTISHFGARSRVYGAEAQEHASGRADFLLDDLADDGQPLAAATAQLASDLFQAFNTVGALQITREGVLQQEAWGSQWPSISRWATTAGIPINPPLQT